MTELALGSLLILIGGASVIYPFIHLRGVLNSGEALLFGWAGMFFFAVWMFVASAAVAVVAISLY